MVDGGAKNVSVGIQILNDGSIGGLIAFDLAMVLEDQL
jgi:hypothetical protein